MYIDDAMNGIVEFASQPWFIILATIVCGTIFFFINYNKRKEYLDGLYASSYNYKSYVGNVVEYEKKSLIITIVAGVLYIVAIILFATNAFGEDSSMVLVIGLIASIVLCIIKQDPVLKVMWRVPTMTLVAKTAYAEERSSNTYSGRIDSNGNVTITKDWGFFTFIMLILMIPLFFIKLAVILVYIVFVTFANFLLYTIVYPIFHTVMLIKFSKEYKTL